MSTCNRGSKVNRRFPLTATVEYFGVHTEKTAAFFTQWELFTTYSIELITSIIMAAILLAAESSVSRPEQRACEKYIKIVCQWSLKR